MTAPFNPFSGPFAGAPGVGGNPIDDEANLITRCPKCKSANFRAWTNQYGIMRACLEPKCKEEWSSGSVAVANPLYSDSELLADGKVAPDIDIPVIQYTGAAFRDPSKLYGDE